MMIRYDAEVDALNIPFRETTVTTKPFSFFPSIWWITNVYVIGVNPTRPPSLYVTPESCPE